MVFQSQHKNDELIRKVHIPSVQSCFQASKLDLSHLLGQESVCRTFVLLGQYEALLFHKNNNRWAKISIILYPSQHYIMKKK